MGKGIGPEQSHDFERVGTMTAAKSSGQPTPFEKFREFTRKVVSVPKAEIDRREKAYKKARKQGRKPTL